MEKRNNQPIVRIAEIAIMISLATVLSLVKPFEAPFGGSVTICSMLPIILVSYKYGLKWGAYAGLAYAAVQLLIDLSKLFSWGLTPTVLIGSFIFDYILAFGVLGLAAMFKNVIKNKNTAFITGTITVVFLRFLMHFLSGFILFSSFATEGLHPLLYSLFYNGSYMGIELVITTVAAFALIPTLKYLGVNK